MTLEINLDFSKSNIINHTCDIDYNPDFDTIITFTHHISEILKEINYFIFEINFNNKKLNLYIDDFGIMIEQIIENLKKIKMNSAFEIDFFEQGSEITIYFSPILNANEYYISILHSQSKEILEEYGTCRIKSIDIYNILLDNLKKFLEITRLYCPNSYKNIFFRKIFNNYLPD